MNNEEIKVLENIVERCKECKFATCEQCEINWKQVQAIENLIKGYKELEEKVNKYEKQIDLEWVEENYIEKSKVREKIEELIKEADYRTEDNPKGRIHFHTEPCDYQIEILQSLLQEGDDK